MVNKSNPVLIPILEVLQASKGAISEYDLIMQLESQLKAERVDSQNLDLFRKHFLVMNALYQLQSLCMEDGFYLLISPLAIRLTRSAQIGEQSIVSGPAEHSLRSYYLDWSNLQEATPEQVDELLSSFWHRYMTNDKQVEACNKLAVDADSNWQTIQSSYRKLARQFHPDMSGDQSGDLARFVEVRQAYEILKQARMKGKK